MRRSLITLLLFLALTPIIVQASPCFEPYTDNFDFANRYYTKDIHVITSTGDAITPLKVWLDTPSCKPYIHRGCTYVEKKDNYHCWSAPLPPITHGGCGYDHTYTVQDVYDPAPTLKHDAPVRKQLVSCYGLGRLLKLQFI